MPLILDFRDGLLFESLERHLLARPGTRARRAAIEATAVERAAAVVTVSEPISRYFRSRYGHGEVVTITNGFDPADLPADEEPAPAPGPPVRIVYTGRLSLSDMGCDVRPFLRGAVDALAARGDDRLRLRFVGQFTREETVAMQPLRDRGVLVVEPLVDRVTALSAQRQADALLLVTGTDRTSVMTGKIFEYLAAGRPIVAVASGTAAGDLVAELGAGWVVSPHDADGISRLIGCLLDDPAVLTAAQPAREAVNRFSRPALAGALAQVLARAAKRSTERSRPE